jgi:hypothetical protein
MNAMLEARMVVTRIQGLASFLHRTWAAVDGLRVSQGVLMEAMDAVKVAQAAANIDMG